jgi:hypothetical protein
VCYHYACIDSSDIYYVPEDVVQGDGDDNGLGEQFSKSLRIRCDLVCRVNYKNHLALPAFGNDRQVNIIDIVTKR